MMARISHRPFSRRHQKAIDAGTLSVDLPERVRVRIWKTLLHYDFSISYQPDPSDRWIENTTGLRELPEKLERVYGMDGLTGCKKVGRDPIDDELKPFFFSCTGAEVFDIVELFFLDMFELKSEFQHDLNEALQDEGGHWILCDGYFLKLDSRWMEDYVLSQAHEFLGKGKFDGALDELREARNYLTAGEGKAATHAAAKSMESLLKALLGSEDGTAKILIDGLKETDFFAELPEPLVRGFGDNVLMALPFLRNKLAGHGQGKEVVAVPHSFAELSVNLAGAFILFLIKRHLEVNPVAAEKEIPESSSSETPIPDDDIPF